MSDFEYEDDLDILTSLMDDEDDEEEKLRKKVKVNSGPSTSTFERRYIKNPGTSQTPATSSSQRDGDQSGSIKTTAPSTQPEESERDDDTQNGQESSPGKTYLKSL